MSAKMRLTMASGMVLFVFILSAVTTVPALADDETPPAPDAPVVTEPEVTSADPVVADETDPAAPADPLPAPVEEVESTPVEETPAAEELLSDLPEGTEVVVVNEEGEPVPLVTQEAAEIIVEGDPIWCPAGVTPGAATCSFSYANLKLLFDNLMNGTAVRGDGITPLSPAGNGVIWITGFVTSGFAADTSSAAIILNGTDPQVASIKDFSLTLKGGWTGVGTTINTADASVFNRTISIFNWLGDITLSDIVITGTAGGDALQITTTRNITLTRVNSNSNSGSGAVLNNSGGTGKITVSASQFNLNGGTYGLSATSQGTITLSNVTASQNTPNGYGAYIDNTGSPAKSGVTLSGVNTFSGNKWDGLSIYSKGAILASDVTASGNGTALGGGGAAFYNAYPLVTAGVTLTGTNIFSDNYSTGLSIYTNGAIKANNLVANSNDGNSYGAYLSNSTALTAQPITLTGSNEFKYNKYSGVYIFSMGLISLNNITANGTLNGSGLSVDHCVDPGGGCTAFGSGGLKLTGINTFNDNSTYGIYARSVGTLTLNSVTANGNGLPGFGYGVYIFNIDAVTPKSVTLTGTNVFNNNKNGGLFVDSLGAIKLNNVTASDTVTGYGAVVDNANTGAVGGVTVSGANFFNDNWFGGLDVTSYGAISLSNTRATGNGLGGGFGNGASLTNSAGSAKPVTLSGVNEFSGNQDTNLYIVTTGVIKLNSVTASDSISGYGAQLNSTYNSATVYSVVLSGTNLFNGNIGGYGLLINASGMISLNNVTANENHSEGLYAFNTGSGSSTPRNVLMTGTNFFNDNWYAGLDIESYGGISLSNVTATGNGQFGLGGNGAYLNNAIIDAVTPRAITLSGTNVFNGNYNSGLYVSSLGAIKVNNVTANDNGVVNSNGAYLNNSGPDAVGGVTLTGTNTFNGNYEEGLLVVTKGAIAINSLRANDNGTNTTHEGAQLSNSGADPLFPKPVTLTGVNEFNGNFGYGLSVSSLGLIKASNLTANENQNGSGVSLYNDIGSSTAGVTLTGINTFNNNWNSGLEVGSYGAINLLTTKITANENAITGSLSGYGVTLTNSGALTPQLVKLMGTNIFNGNYSGGLQIASDGAITASNLTANGNTNGSGANLNNAGSGAAGPVTLTGTNSFNDNYSTGLVIDSLGAITASNLTASDNTNGLGADLSNDLGAGAVTLNGKNTFNGNYDIGLDISTDGAITLNNVTANGNGASGFGYGAFLYNSTASTPQAVKLTGTNTFNSNQTIGLYVISKGAVTINNLSASYTVAGGGAQIFNNAVGAVGNVTLTGNNTFTENNGNGLQIGSLGNVSLTKVTADGNTGDGLYTNPNGTITLVCGSFTNNTAYGWHLTSLAGITLKGVFSAGNGSGDTWFGSAPVVTRTCPLP